MNPFPGRKTSLTKETERLYLIDYQLNLQKDQSSVFLSRTGTVNVLTRGDALAAYRSLEEQLPCEAGYTVLHCLIVNIICLGERKKDAQT